MKRIKIYFRSILELLLIGLLILALVVVIDTLIPRQPLASPPVVLTISPYPLPEYLTPKPLQQITSYSYPPPIATNPLPPPTIKETQATPGFVGTITPYPITPYPTPTLKPGPRPTPIPTIEPAKDASGTIFFVAKGDKDTNATLHSMSVDGTAIIKNEPTSLSDINLSWGPIFPSPDGKKLVITGDWGAMGLYDVTKGKFETLNHYMDNVSVAFFNWFPDSRQILFRDSMGNLILADPITGEHTNLVVPGYGNVDGAAASPDGQDIVYSLSKHLGAPDEIWIINTDGRDSRLLTNGPAPVTNMAWSPNGKLIAFFGLGWMVMNADGSNLRELTSGINLPQCYSLPTIWSPDSNFLAVVTTKVNGSFCQGWGDKNFDTTNIILINVSNGKDYPLLSDDSTGNIDPAWSPDGSYIAFVSNRSGTPEVWVVKSDGSDLRQITEYDSLTRYPLWRRPY